MKKNNSEVVYQKQQLKKQQWTNLLNFLIKLTNQRRTISINEYYDGMFEPISIVSYYKLFVIDNYNTVGNIFKRPPYKIKQHI